MAFDLLISGGLVVDGGGDASQSAAGRSSPFGVTRTGCAVAQAVWYNTMNQTERCSDGNPW